MRNTVLLVSASAVLALGLGCPRKSKDESAKKSPTPTIAITVKKAPPPMAGEEWLVVPGTRVGKIPFHDPDFDEAALKKAYGADHVVDTEMHLGEGEMAAATSLFGADPTKKLMILWANDGNKKGVEVVKISGEKSKWKTRDGITLGTTLKELERLNKRSFTLYGFEWDFGGTVSDWKNGDLDESLIGVGLVMSYADGADRKVAEKVAGDSEFGSDHPSMQKLNPTVVEMTVTGGVGGK